MVATAVERVFDAKPINAICNHPTVRPSLGGDGKSEIDVASIIGNPLNIVLHHEGFAAIYLAIQPGMYEVHTQALPSARVSGTVLKSAAATLHHMFSKTNAVEILTRIPDGNDNARRLVEALGFTTDFRVARGWIEGEHTEPCAIYTITLTRWMATARGLGEIGRQFHDAVDDACDLAGILHTSRDPDDVLDRHAGAVHELIVGGQMNKGVFYFNRFAAMAGYKPLAPISESPAVVHLGEIAVKVTADGVEVVTCQ